MLDGFGVAALRLEQNREAVLRQVVTGGGPYDSFELILCAGDVAHHVQRRAEPVPEGGVVRCELEAVSKQRRRARPVFVIQRLNSPGLIRLRTFEQRFELDDQRIRRQHLAIFAQAKMDRRLRRVADRAVRHRERIVDRGSLRVPPQYRFEMLDRAGVLLFGERHAPETEQRRPRAGLERQRPLEVELRLCGLSLVEVQVAQPHQRRHILGLQLKGALEGRDRVGEVAVLAMQVSEIVRPANVTWRERLRVDEAWFGRIALVGGHEQLAELTVRVCKFHRGRASLLNLPRECFVARPHLRLGGRRHPGHVGPRDRLQSLPFVSSAAGRGRDEQREECPRHRRFLPPPSLNVVYRSIVTSAHSSIRPSGQRTRSVGFSVDRPRPISTRGSFADA